MFFIYGCYKIIHNMIMTTIQYHFMISSTIINLYTIFVTVVNTDYTPELAQQYTKLYKGVYFLSNQMFIGSIISHTSL